MFSFVGLTWCCSFCVLRIFVLSDSVMVLMAASRLPGAAGTYFGCS